MGSRSRMRKAVHVVVHVVPAGARKIIVRSNGREVGTMEVTVPNGPAATADAPVVAKLPGGGC